MRPRNRLDTAKTRAQLPDASSFRPNCAVGIADYAVLLLSARRVATVPRYAEVAYHRSTVKTG